MYLPLVDAALVKQSQLIKQKLYGTYILTKDKSLLTIFRMKSIEGQTLSVEWCEVMGQDRYTSSLW